jgi:DNA polymerase-1
MVNSRAVESTAHRPLRARCPGRRVNAQNEDMTDEGLRPTELVAALERAGLRRGQPLALVLRGSAVGLAVRAGGLCSTGGRTGEPAEALASIERRFRPRWVWWSNDAPAQLIAAGLRLATCWDLAAVHRLLYGGWRADPARVWAALHGLSEDSLPRTGQLDLLGGHGDEGTDPEDPLRPDGHLRPEWVDGGWARTPTRMSIWALRAIEAADLQLARLAELSVRGDAIGAAHSESAAELLCAELEADGLPVDLGEAARLIGSFIGRRAADDADAVALRARRDAAVLSQAAPGEDADLRNPAQVRTMLARVGIDVPDTRSWRLEHLRGAHPVVEPLLTWRRAERIATTYGYGWLDAHVGPDARLRGRWTGSDGAAGRMTAQAGLHNLPAELRPAIAAPPGSVLVRADLGQIEPRVLAVVSRDPALARATQDDDLYQPVALRLGVARPVAKVAVLAAM